LATSVGFTDGLGSSLEVAGPAVIVVAAAACSVLRQWTVAGPGRPPKATRAVSPYPAEHCPVYSAGFPVWG